MTDQLSWCNSASLNKTTCALYATAGKQQIDAQAMVASVLRVFGFRSVADPAGTVAVKAQGQMY